MVEQQELSRLDWVDGCGRALVRLEAQRAQEHLAELRALVAPYDKVRPLRVEEQVQKRTGRCEYKVFPIEDPDPWLGIVVGDVLYNLRSGLDHLRCQLVPKARRKSGEFPILTDDIWATDGYGALLEAHANARRKWDSSVKGMAPDALAAVEALQPFRINPTDALHLGLAMVSKFNNEDKHRDLIVVNNFPRITRVVVDDATGRHEKRPAAPASPHLWGHGAVVHKARKPAKVSAFGALDVTIGGPANVTGPSYLLLDSCETIVAYTAHVFEELRPHART